MNKIDKPATPKIAPVRRSRKMKELARVRRSELAARYDPNPKVRDRINAELDAAGIPPDKRVPYLSNLTGRKYHTVMRWFDDAKPGLPDLKSFGQLCFQLDLDANWLLGLIDTRFPFPNLPIEFDSQRHPDDDHRLEWISYLSQQISQEAGHFELRYMSGDDMEPRIKDGAPYWVDTTETQIHANGIYLLEYQSRLLVRQVEIRIGEGICLNCENPRYQQTVIKDETSAREEGLNVLGRVRLAVGIEKF